MTDLVFKYGSLIRSGPQLVNGGKWDATLEDEVRNGRTNADLTIFIRVFFSKIDPASGKKGLYPDTDDTPANPSKRRIQAWGRGEFDRFANNLVAGAQRFWNGVFWLKTPNTYADLDWPDESPTHHCHLYCKFALSRALDVKDSHYTIAAVRVADNETFRSNSRLYSQRDIESENMIPHSTAKFWTHFHEVGHLLGLGHVGHGASRNVHGDNSAQAYGVTMQEMTDVMGRGSLRHSWHALPWQQAAEEFTGVAAKDWTVHMKHIWPTVLATAGRR
ncbi:MAG TPA: hypothetical protein VNV25_10205 [Gemmatimonadaceae bacterium]|jgi:hypothetical protein|nr:hypothetical protein [Gemmatimonadaceae bacterium]